MAGVVWAGRDGNLVETVIAVMLSRRYPLAERIRASRGDGGIDVQLPDGDGWAIYQIKSYTTRFRKDHVEGSFNRLKAYIADKAIQVTSWNLVMPMDPSKEARRWLTSLTGDAGFHCGWPGKIFVDGLAAEFPDVIEYYFGDGAQRLAETIQQVAAITGALRRGERATSSTPLLADDAEHGLANLHRALNKFDPHYLYDYSVTHEPPSPEHGEGFIVARTTEHDGAG